ncbi:MAG: DUF1854 domain-containing protein [Anaerolineae bacterium]|nr:DUF1854 domain-containing protein [Anaerolineae bacterium]
MIEATVEPKAYELCLLDPQKLRFSYSPIGAVRLEIAGERCYLSVEIARSFPIDEEDHYLSVRNALDEEHPEIGMIADVEGLDPESRLVVQEELYRRYFVPRILTITRLKEEFGVLNFDVETDRGPREFSVRNPQEHLREIGDERMLVIDIDGCRYEIPDLRQLDRKSAAILRDYVDS